MSRTGGSRTRIAQFEIEQPSHSPFSFRRTNVKKVAVCLSAIVLCAIGAGVLSTVFWHVFNAQVLGTDTQPTTRSSEIQSSKIHLSEIKQGTTESTHVTNNRHYSQQTSETTSSILPSTVSLATTTEISRSADCPTRIVGYYDGSSAHEIREDQLRKLTHVIFSSIDLNAKGDISFQSFEMRQKFLKLLEMSRKVDPMLKVMISIQDILRLDILRLLRTWLLILKNGGKHLLKILYWLQLNFRKLAQNIISLIQQHQLDGVDLFWIWPTKLENRESFVSVLQEIRLHMHRQYFSRASILTVLLPNYDWPEYNNTIDLNGILNFVDFINVHSIDYYGFWDSKWGAYTGPPSPLYSGLGRYGDSNVDWTMTHYACTTGKYDQLNMVVPFFGAHWQNVEGPIDDKGEMWFSAKSRTDGESDFEGGYLPWRDLEKNGWDLSLTKWHQESRTPFIWNPDQKKFLGFENSQSLREKVEYAQNYGLGGITIWSVEMDDGSDTLLNSIADFCINRDTFTRYRCENKHLS